MGKHLVEITETTYDSICAALTLYEDGVCNMSPALYETLCEVVNAYTNGMEV